MIDNAKLARALYRTILRREPSHMETLHHIPDLVARRYFEVINRLLLSQERKLLEPRYDSACSRHPVTTLRRSST